MTEPVEGVEAKFVVIDTETTGLHYFVNNIYEIAAVVLDKDLNILDRFESFMRPIRAENVIGRPLEMLNERGISAEDLTKFPSTKAVMAAFCAWLEKWRPSQGKLIPVGHNWPFDQMFIEYTLRQCKLGWKLDYHFIDTCAAANLMLNTGRKSIKNVKLSTLVEQFDVEIEGNLHCAMTDVLATMEVLRIFVTMIDFMWQQMEEIDNNGPSADSGPDGPAGVGV